MDTPLGSVLYITLGCAKNEVDTDRMRSLLTAAGYEEAFDPQDADIAIVNTCSFLASATSESIETTLELANEVQDGVRSCPIVMCGCVPSRYGDDLPDELPEVAAFVKADEEDGIVAVIDGVLGVEREIAAYIPQVKRTVEGAVAYVKISDGCNRFCSFCMIPYIRGRYHSRNAESIISEVRDLVAGGVREIVLIGQDTGIWGTDFADEDVAEGSPRNLAQLLRAVAEAVRPQNVWVRVLYLQPEGMTDELIETIRDTPEVLPYIDIPVQHCDARILKAMRRSGSRQELEDLFRDLRERIPGIVIRRAQLLPGVKKHLGVGKSQFRHLLQSPLRLQRIKASGRSSGLHQPTSFSMAARRVQMHSSSAAKAISSLGGKEGAMRMLLSCGSMP